MRSGRESAPSAWLTEPLALEDHLLDVHAGDRREPFLAVGDRSVVSVHLQKQQAVRGARCLGHVVNAEAGLDEAPAFGKCFLYVGHVLHAVCDLHA